VPLPSSPEAPSTRDVLRRDDAEARRRRVARADYELDFDLAAGADGYTGRAAISFELADPGEPLFLEFTGHVVSLRVNGRDVPASHEHHRIWLPGEAQADHMRVEIEYRNRYDRTGEGFHHFRDPEDEAEYVYSNLQPFAAHRLFPCFDQPDIKGTYRLSVNAPAEWHVVSSQPGEARPLPGGRRRHVFQATPPFSTYLLPLIAGPFERREHVHDGIPLALYARRTMRAELDRHADEIWEITSAGLDFYRRLFDQPFPFAKHDQLFMPEFNAGAMENVGAVTFHDSFLFRDPPTYGQRLERGEVVLHELAHSWFGNLVTTRWWDDLWLNESFATYISYLCLAEGTRFEDAWQVFNGMMRPAAYRQDQLRTTHPIAAEVPDTEAAVGNFDAITYEKGAAVLKQLVATIGRDAFSDGLRRYFRRHAWGNASLSDFLSALGEAAGHPLEEWAGRWLRTPSLNTTRVEWTGRDGRIETMELLQEAPVEHPHLRPHAVVIGLVSEEAGSGLELRALPVSIDDAVVEVPGARGLLSPLLVFPNLGDHDYALAHLDPASMAFVRERLPDLSDHLLRQQVWSSLWEMVRDAKLPVLEHLAIVRRFAPRESDIAMLETILANAQKCLVSYVPEAELATETAALVATALEHVGQVEDADQRITWARAAIGAAGSEADLVPLLALLDGDRRIDGFALDQDMRWSLAVKSAAHGVSGADERLALESDRDRSDRGARALLRAGVSRPDATAKAEAWRRIHAEGYGSDYLTRAAMAGFNWRHQRDLVAPYRDAFFERVREVFARRDHAFVHSYVQQLSPTRWAEPQILERMRDFVTDLGEPEALLRRQLVEVADDLERAIRVRRAARGADLAGAGAAAPGALP
jgi:aminopeptidase N